MLIAAGLLSVLLLSLISSALLTNDVQAQTAPALPPVPAGLKPQFSLGLSNQPDNLAWMQSSGAAWDARYQYLAGGVNTAGNWKTWQYDQLPPGQFAQDYMDNSYQAGYLPVFTWYQLLQSSPSSGVNEAEKDYNNLNNPATMNAYFADFKLLLDKARAFSKPVIIHIEPDLWGYLQQRSINPANVNASVASSGYAEVAVYANNAAGFARALIGLRDKYASNVLLAYHISPWASTSGDLASDTRATFDVATAAQQTANFYNQTAASFDLLFYDIADRDSALYASWGSNRWWDVTNTLFPNFNRFNQFVSLITSATGKRGMLWQVPIGNTLYLTMNNTTQHWQDNRVQYYLGGDNNQQVQDLANSGLMGVMFGAGDGQTTTYSDSAKDGITNPTAVNGNNLVASYADDDGGYLRLRAQAYYGRGALALPGGTTPPPTPTNTPLPTITPAPTLTVAPPPVSPNGLNAAYFSNKSLAGTPLLQRTDATINFNWGKGSPGSGLPSDNFSVRWTGLVKAPTSETYTFCTRSDDGVRLWISGQLLVDKWVTRPAIENCAQLALAQGQSYSLKMEYFESNGSAQAALLWQAPSIVKQVIPQAQLLKY